MDDVFLSKDQLPSWFYYQVEFTQAIKSGVYDVGPWQILSGTWLGVRLEGLKKRFPDRELVPFARRLDNDDVACWERTLPGAVQVVHDFAAPGWEEREGYSSFEQWLEAARSEAGGWED